MKATTSKASDRATSNSALNTSAKKGTGHSRERQSGGAASDVIGDSEVSASKASDAGKTIEGHNWDQKLGFLMHDVSRLRRTVFDEFMKPLGITRSQWWVLANLSRHDGMIQSDLANDLELGKAALGGLVDRLEAAALVERRWDEFDRRAKRVYLSAKGVKLISEMRVKSNEMSELMLAGLGIHDRHALAGMLSVIKNNLLSLKQDKNVDGAQSEFPY